jgi:hypothetical protein
MNKLKDFIKRQCIDRPNETTKYGDFCAAFVAWLEPAERSAWGKHAIGHALDELGLVRGIKCGGIHLANLILRRDATYLVRGDDGMLRRVPLAV